MKISPVIEMSEFYANIFIDLAVLNLMNGLFEKKESIQHFITSFKHPNIKIHLCVQERKKRFNH